jgi:hypothetical protein
MRDRGPSGFPSLHTKYGRIRGDSVGFGHWNVSCAQSGVPGVRPLPQGRPVPKATQIGRLPVDVGREPLEVSSQPLRRNISYKELQRNGPTERHRPHQVARRSGWLPQACTRFCTRVARASVAGGVELRGLAADRVAQGRRGRRSLLRRTHPPRRHRRGRARAVALRLERQPAQGRGAERSADRRAVAGVRALVRIDATASTVGSSNAVRQSGTRSHGR